MFESSRAARLLRVVGAVLYRQAHPWTRAWFIRVHFAVLVGSLRKINSTIWDCHTNRSTLTFRLQNTNLVIFLYAEASHLALGGACSLVAMRLHLECGQVRMYERDGGSRGRGLLASQFGLHEL